MNEQRVSVRVDYWLDADRLTEAEARDYVSARRWYRVRQGFWVSDGAIMQFYVCEQPLSVLVWFITL